LPSLFWALRSRLTSGCADRKKPTRSQREVAPLVSPFFAKPADAVLAALQRSVQNGTWFIGFNLVQQYALGGAKFSGLDVSLPSVIAFVRTPLVLLISLPTISRETPLVPCRGSTPPRSRLWRDSSARGDRSLNQRAVPEFFTGCRVQPFLGVSADRAERGQSPNL
jgi:hypothetical protein